VGNVTTVRIRFPGSRAAIFRRHRNWPIAIASRSEATVAIRDKSYSKTRKGSQQTIKPLLIRE
jgi:hypothetical protein